KAAGRPGCVSCRWGNCRSETSCSRRRSRWKVPKAARSPSPEASFRTDSRHGKAGRFLDGAGDSRHVASPLHADCEANWCEPACGRPVRERGSARLVANLAWPLATVAAKRTDRLHTDLKIAL